MNKGYIIGAVALVIVFVCGVAFPRPAVVERVVEQLGAAVSNEFIENRIAIGGADYFSYSMPMQANSNMPCVFRTPAATSTLVAAGADFRVGTSSAQQVYIGLSTNGTTLGTTISSLGLGSGAKGAFAYTGASSTVIAPSQYVVLNVAGGKISTAPQGTCTALLQVISK